MTNIILAGCGIAGFGGLMWAAIDLIIFLSEYDHD